jgi:hypothetical protein
LTDSTAAREFDTAGTHDFDRVFVVAATAAYAFALVWTYVKYLSVVWNYAGFTYQSPGEGLSLLSFVFAISPAIAMPRAILTPRVFITWLIYLTVYIPSMLLPVLMGNLSDVTCLELMTALAVGFGLVILPELRLGAVHSKPMVTLSEKAFWQLFTLLYVILNIWVLISFGGQLHLVSLADVYTQRGSADSVLRSSFVGYAIGVLGGALNPFLMAVGLKRRPLLYVIGAVGQVLLFSTTASKLVILSPLLILGVYLLLFWRRSRFGVLPLVLVVSGVAVSLGLLGSVLQTSKSSPLLSFALSLVYTRTFGMVGILTSVYAEFFQTHALTYFSHIVLVRNFWPYPYGDALGLVIGGYMFPGDADVMDANASFFATDGIAALGIPGIVLAGALFRQFVWLFDSSANRQNTDVACAALVPVLMSVANASMFTTLLSNGGAALAVILYVYCYGVDTHGAQRSPSIAAGDRRLTSRR